MTSPPAARATQGWCFYGWWGIVLPAFLIIWTSNGLTTGGIAAFDPYLIQALGVERGALKLGDAIQLLASAGLTVGTGWLGDRYGVRPLMFVGIAALAGSFFGLSRVDSIADVYLLRGLMGLSLGCAGLVLCTVIVSRWFVASRGLALGLMLAGTSLGNALFPSLYTWLIQGSGWRSAAVYASLTPLVLLPLVAFAIREWPAAIGLKPYGGGGFPRSAGTVADPPSPSYGQILGRREFWLIAIAAFCTFYSILGISGNLILHLRDLQFPPELAAAAFFPLFIMGLVGKIASGWLADRFGRRPVWIADLLLMLAGALMLASLQKSLVIPGVTAFGLGWGANYTLLQALVADNFEPQALGRTMGAINVLDAGGGAIGPWITALLFDAYGSYAPGFSLICGLVCVAIVMALLLGPAGNRPATATV